MTPINYNTDQQPEAIPKIIGDRLFETGTGEAFLLASLKSIKNKQKDVVVSMGEAWSTRKTEIGPLATNSAQVDTPKAVVNFDALTFPPASKEVKPVDPNARPDVPTLDIEEMRGNVRDALV